MSYCQDVPIDVAETEIICRVTYDWTPGRPAHTPRGEYAPIDPPEPPEVEILTVEIKGAGPAPSWFWTAVEESQKVFEWLANHHQEPAREYERD